MLGHGLHQNAQVAREDYVGHTYMMVLGIMAHVVPGRGSGEAVSATGYWESNAGEAGKF